MKGTTLYKLFIFAMVLILLIGLWATVNFGIAYRERPLVEDYSGGLQLVSSVMYTRLCG